MAASIDKDIPQWKKDLILRRRNQNKRLTTGTENKQLFSLSPQSKSDAVGRAGHQPRITTAVPVTCSNGEVVEKCTAHSSSVSDKMVQERTWSNKQCAYEVTKNENGDNKSDSDSSEDLHYGPGIVNKLKNRYLSLALRENNTKSRPSILHMRKATSLENLLDNDNCIDSRETTESRLFDSKLNNCNDVTKNVPYRYRRGSRSDMKRAHSVETISRTDHNTFSVEQKPKRESMHEEMLITNIGNDRGNKEISDKVPEIPVSNKMFAIINKPKRIAPIMNEREKPPVDVVKQTKRIFEGRPEQRTKPLHTTGEVAAKVATYKSIIVQTKANKKPLIKQKPSHSVLADKNRRTNHPPVIRPAAKTQGRLENSNAPSQHNIPQNKTHSLPSLIPDVSKTNEFSTANRQGNKRISSLSETPDLILHSSPSIVSPSYRIESTRTFLSEEIKNCYKFVVSETKVRAQVNKDTPDCLPARHVTPDSGKSASSKPGNSVTYNFSNAHQNESFPRNQQGVLAQPSKSAVNGIAHNETISLRPIVNTGSPPKLVQAQLSKNESITDPVNNIKPSLTVREIENNSINAAKTLERPPSGNRESVLKVEVTKVKKPARAQEQNSIVFKFTDRKDIPDYVGNDGLSRIGKVERPKTGEGGIILLPGASLDESFTDEDDDWLHSLEGPPSPCDVTFINDNILIDGRSSLSQRSKKQKMKISFVESIPEIFEYPSEISLMDDVSSTSSSGGSSVGHGVPSLGGSSLANYTPKSGNPTEHFQLGVTRSVPTVVPTMQVQESPQDVEEPVLFSAGTNSDMLF